MIIQGNSYRIGLRDESIHAIVTSFPYHGLRDYGLPPTIWGGDSLLQCTSCDGIIAVDNNYSFLREVQNEKIQSPNRTLAMSDMRRDGQPLQGRSKKKGSEDGQGMLQESQRQDCPTGRENESAESAEQLRGNQYQLEGWEEEDGGGVYLRYIPDGSPKANEREPSEVHGGTQVSDGEASGALPGGLGKGTSQERGQGRQPNRESGTSQHEAAPRQSEMPPLRGMVLDSLACPVCNRHEWSKISCPHIWETERTARPNASGGPSEKQDSNRGSRVSDYNDRATYSQFCQLCGAWLGCFGLEPTIGLHVQNAVAVCREIKRVLRRDGVFFLNYGDSYATGKNGRSAADTKAAGKDDRTFRDKPFSVTELPAKNLCMIPARVAIALQEDGWILRSEFPWLKLNAMPSSVTDRPGTAHEHVFMLVKSARYYFDMMAVRRSALQPSGKPELTGQQKRAVLQQLNGSTLGTNQGAPSRALRTSDPFFDSLDAYIAHLQDVRDNGGLLVDSEGLPAALVVNTESYAQAHYATFPRKLIAPLIKTTPEKVCPNCGAAWQRMKQPTPEYAANFGSNNGADSDRYGKGYKKHSKAVTAEYVTTGWQPTCKCIQKRAPNFGMTGGELLELADEVIKELAPIGGIILDPFCGSGTVGAVAAEHGRRFIGIDLSATYLAENALPRSEKLTSAKSLAQLPMFREAA